VNGALWHREGPKETPWPRANEPSKATPLGNAQREPLGIFLGNTAIDRVEEAIATDPEASITGLLIGYPFTGPYRPFILVTEALIVDFPINEDGEPEFSSHGFADAYPAFAELGSDVSVVGWFSAQPRKAPELSAYERYSHRKHFPEKWQLAFVIDTLQGTSRLYRWDEDRLVSCDQYYFWNRTSEPVESLLFQEAEVAPAVIAYDEPWDEEVAVAAAADVPSRTTRKKRTIIPWIVAAACLLLIYLLIPQAPGSIFWLRARQADQATDLYRLEQDLAMLVREAEILESIREQAPPAPELEPGRETASNRPQEAASSASGASGASSASGASASGTALPATSAPQASQGTGSGAPGSTLTASISPAVETPTDAGGDYVIQPGDTMWSISTTLLGDPWRFRSLAEDNQIADPNVIFPGQRLRLPSDSEPQD